MSCNNCTETQDPNCGCTSEALHINQICNPVVCPVDECAESFSAACIRYTGADLICDNITVVETDTNMAQAIANIMAFVCANDIVGTALTCGNTTVVPANSTVEEALGLMFQFFCSQFITTEVIECQESPQASSIVVPSGTTFAEALELIVEYFCDRFAELDFPVDDLVAGAGITVTSNTVGNVTTYTITNSSPASSVTLTSAGGTETLVNDGTGPALAVKGLTGGAGITLSSNATAISIANTSPASSVTLTNAGATESLVNDGIGPDLATKSLTAGNGIGITSNATEVTITNLGLKKYVFEYSVPDEEAPITILRSAWDTCIPTVVGCGATPIQLNDIIIQGYYYDAIAGYWKQFTFTDKTVIAIDLGGNIIIDPAWSPFPSFPVTVRIVVIG
jgi:hypothetical protein